MAEALSCTDCWEPVKEKIWEMFQVLSRVSAAEETAPGMSSTTPAFPHNVAMRKAAVATVTARRARYR